jgi:hypothetical protein
MPESFHPIYDKYVKMLELCVFKVFVVNLCCCLLVWIAGGLKIH